MQHKRKNMNKAYQKEYKKSYNLKNKIITFPLSNIFYEELRKRSIYYDLSVNSFSKHIVTNFLNNERNPLLTKEKAKLMQNYIHISRGIANNINQIAYNSNIGEFVDINILISSLKHYEDEFKKYITNL